MEVKAVISSKDGSWRVKVKELGIDDEIPPVAYDLSDLPEVLTKIEETIREKTRADLSTNAPLTILQSDLKVSVLYSVRSPRDRTLGEFETAAEPDEDEPPQIEGQEIPLLTDGEDIDALCKELDEAGKVANGGPMKILYEDVSMSLGEAAKRMIEKGDLTIEDVKGQIESFRAEAGIIVDEVEAS
jgi:hypothetical protein